MFKVFNLKTAKSNYYSSYEELRNVVQRDFGNLCKANLDDWIAERDAMEIVIHNHIISIVK